MAVLARLPPSLNSCIGLLRNFVYVISRNFHEILNIVSAKFSSNFAKIKIILTKFCVLRNFAKISFNFAKLEENFAKHEIKNFVKFRKITKMEILQQPYSYTICHLLLTLPLPSARRFFNAVRQL